MSVVDDFLSSHQLDKYALVETSDDMMGTHKTVGALVKAGMDCRALEMAAWERKEYEQRGLIVTDKFHFSSDPQVTLDHVLKFDGNWYYVRAVKNQAKMDVVFTVIAQYTPQVE